MNGRNGGAALLALRLLVGWLFLWHGLGKLVGPPFAGVGLDAFSGILSLHFGSLSDALIIALATGIGVMEIAGGFMLLLGWQTGLAASVLLLGEVANIALIRFDYGPFGPMGWEDILVVMVALLALVLGGPGAFALDLRLRPGQTAPGPAA
jgi:putative oxidoreductase